MGRKDPEPRFLVKMSKTGKRKKGGSGQRGERGLSLSGPESAESRVECS